MIGFGYGTGMDWGHAIWAGFPALLVASQLPVVAFVQLPEAHGGSEPAPAAGAGTAGAAAEATAVAPAPGRKMTQDGKSAADPLGSLWAGEPREIWVHCGLESPHTVGWRALTKMGCKAPRFFIFVLVG